MVWITSLREFIPEFLMSVLAILYLVRSSKKQQLEKTVEEKELLKEARLQLKETRERIEELELTLSKYKTQNDVLLIEVAKIPIIETQLTAAKKALTECISVDM